MSTPTLPDLINRAIEDHNFLADFRDGMAMPTAKAMLLASRALQGAIEDWQYDNGQAEIIRPLMDAALARLLDIGWDDREAHIHARIAEQIASETPHVAEYSMYMSV